MNDFLASSLSSENLLFYLFAYGLAATPTSYLVARLIHKIDLIKDYGHSHTAATIWRSISKRSGVLVFVLDFLKGVIPCAIAESLGSSIEIIALIGLVAVIGHCFSIWLMFNGGKGAATTAGVLLIVYWPSSVIGILLFLILLKLRLSAGYSALISTLVAYCILFLGLANKIVWLIVALMVGVIFIRHKNYLLGIFSRR